jgi:putative heme iron utilization protein
MNPTAAKQLHVLVEGANTAALGTLHQGEPFVSMTPYALPRGEASFLIHVSALAAHTADMLAHPRVSLMIMAAPASGAPAQARARVTIQADAVPLERGSPEYDAGRAAYLSRFPEAATMFELGDFHLFRLVPVSARVIGGFAQAATFAREAITEALRSR